MNRRPSAAGWGFLSRAAAVAVVGLVALAMSTTSGMPIIGKTAEGWILYGRVAQFANCDEIDPPRKLSSLCVTDLGLRPGPDYYRFIGGPAVQRFGAPPRGDSQLNDFAIRTILAQPFDYTKTVAIDSLRFFAHNFGSERAYNSPVGTSWSWIAHSIRPAPTSTRTRSKTGSRPSRPATRRSGWPRGTRRSRPSRVGSSCCSFCSRWRASSGVGAIDAWAPGFS